MTTLSSLSTAQNEEVMVINITNLVIKFESGAGNNTIPLLLMESSFNCNVKDFYNNKRMTVIGNFNVEMAYYNAKLALWEHVIETRGLGYRPDGQIIRKRWDMNVTLQQNATSDLGSAIGELKKYRKVSPPF